MVRHYDKIVELKFALLSILIKKLNKKSSCPLRL